MGLLGAWRAQQESISFILANVLPPECGLLRMKEEADNQEITPGDEALILKRGQRDAQAIRKGSKM